MYNKSYCLLLDISSTLRSYLAVLGLCGDIIWCTLCVMVYLLLFFFMNSVLLVDGADCVVIRFTACLMSCFSSHLPFYVQLDLLFAITYFIHSALLIRGWICCSCSEVF